ncbi:MBL fold metallo-hydrolase [Acuticoccus sp. M5D2P5]|uniref:MBL fold metallo-hydrolase n=1 Tax=Acuticoccus kalidii TaxID=2910977 RepID=UPI001F22157E|nr:MBL fold metallo-hydrolase [Acuticoccus kalidii]MCF3932589.1 MBL fold metallo-hydrolase [Acuticoccus kalidii]
MTRLVYTILGCGSSGGVPRIDGEWGACDPANPKNRRRRCSLLVERVGRDGTTRVLIDSGPDMREQLLSAGVSHLDAVLYTHPHADHLHGIDDLRGLAVARKRRVDVYMDEPTFERAREAFAYCFKEVAKGYPAILNAHIVEPGAPVTIDGPGGPLTLLPFEQLHGHIRSLGYRIGNLAYSSDLHDLPPHSLAHLEDLDVWIIDALRYTTHASHLTVDEAVGWIDRMRAKSGVLTNLHHDLDYASLADYLPEHVVPAFDLMRLEAPYEDAGRVKSLSSTL